MDSSNICLPWFKPGRETVLRLFCLPHAGGGTAGFARWPTQLPATIDVQPILLPGREQRFSEPLAAHFGPLVDDLAASLLPLTAAPYALFGHSLGALLAFEVARRLRTHGAAGPTCLVVAGCRAPQWHEDSPPLHSLSDADLLSAADARYGAVPEAIRRNAELVAIFAPILRADLTLMETYQYNDGPPLACPVVAFGGHEDAIVPPEALAAWRAQTTAAFSLEMLPGGHFFLQENLAFITQRLASLLDGVD